MWTHRFWGCPINRFDAACRSAYVTAGTMCAGGSAGEKDGGGDTAGIGVSVSSKAGDAAMFYNHNGLCVALGLLLSVLSFSSSFSSSSSSFLLCEIGPFQRLKPRWWRPTFPVASYLPSGVLPSQWRPTFPVASYLPSGVLPSHWHHTNAGLNSK
jgi:hypothetical protein